MKVIIAGGRDFNNYELLKEKCNKILINKSDIEIVSGGADGADRLGESYAKDMGYPIKYFPADWKKYGNAAGPIRNKQMAEYADSLIVFWDWQSKGTKNMIKNAQDIGLQVRIIRY